MLYIVGFISNINQFRSLPDVIHRYPLVRTPDLELTICLPTLDATGIPCYGSVSALYRSTRVLPAWSIRNKKSSLSSGVAFVHNTRFEY